ncbi:MAG: hypothetical protein GX639_06150 [Fibrobacter sp.]|nr:hypothetical protein [Fibrobacter sp.]
MVLHKLFQAIAPVVMSALALCQSGNITGNSSQTGSGGITVASVNGVVSGTTSSNARISMYVWDYVVKSDKPMFSDTVYADETGKFSFNIVADAYYNLLVVDTDGKMGFIRNIPVFKTSVFDTSLEKIEKPGTLKGIAYDRSGESFASALVRMRGAAFFTRADNNGAFTLDAIPSGSQIIEVVNDMIVNTAMITELVDSAEIMVIPDKVVVWDKKW